MDSNVYKGGQAADELNDHEYAAEIMVSHRESKSRSMGN